MSKNNTNAKRLTKSEKAYIASRKAAAAKAAETRAARLAEMGPRQLAKVAKVRHAAAVKAAETRAANAAA